MYSNTVFFLVNSNHKVKGFLTETDPDALSHIRVLEIVHGQGWPLVLEDEKRREQRRMGPKSLVWKPGQVDLLTFGGKYKGYDVVVKLVGEKLTGKFGSSATVVFVFLSLRLRVLHLSRK